VRRLFSHKTAVIAAALLAAIVMVSQQASSETVNRIVAVVNGEIITLVELDAAVAAIKGGFKGELSEAKDAEIRNKVLDGLIEEKLVKIYSERAGIDVSEKEIDNAVEDIKRQNRFTHEALVLTLSNSGITYKEYRDQLKEDIRRSKFMNRFIRTKVKMGEDDVRDYYANNIDEFRSEEEVRLMVLFLSGKIDDKKNVARIEAIRGALASGEDFAVLVGRHSDGGHGDKGGDMGYLKKSELSDDYALAIEGLLSGKIAGPIPSKDGVYFFNLVDVRKGEAVPFNEVKDKLADRLYSKLMKQKYDLWIDEVKKIASIEVRL